MRRWVGVVLLLVVVMGWPIPPQHVAWAGEEAGLVGEDTFGRWPRLTPKPIRVPPAAWLLCRAPSTKDQAKRDAEAKRHGPHAELTIMLRISPGQETAYREGKRLPVGTTVIKEKREEATSPKLHAYAVMIKREPGYFPEGGDWEYGFVSLEGKRVETRGRLDHCAQCHAMTKSTDYLFRSPWPTKP
jgi:hypothetical protein